MMKILKGILCATAALAEGVLGARAPAADGPAVTTADYERAEHFLSYNTTPLVLHSAGPATWLPDETAWYQIRTSQGATAVLVDPAARIREEGSPRAKQAAAPGASADPASAPSPDGKLVAFILH